MTHKEISRGVLTFIGIWVVCGMENHGSRWARKREVTWMGIMVVIEMKKKEVNRIEKREVSGIGEREVSGW